MEHFYFHGRGIALPGEQVDDASSEVILDIPQICVFAEIRRIFLWSLGVLILYVCVGFFFSYVVIPIRIETPSKQLLYWHVPTRFGFSGYQFLPAAQHILGHQPVLIYTNAVAGTRFEAARLLPGL